MPWFLFFIVAEELCKEADADTYALDLELPCETTWFDNHPNTTLALIILGELLLFSIAIGVGVFIAHAGLN